MQGGFEKCCFTLSCCVALNVTEVATHHNIRIAMDITSRKQTYFQLRTVTSDTPCYEILQKFTGNGY